MSDKLSKHAGIMDWLQSMIPGYTGYLKQESRREDDRRTRQYISERLSDCKNLLQDHLKTYLASADLDAISSGDKLRSDLDMLQQRIDSAVDGYGGWFSTGKVERDAFERISQLDAAAISDIDRIAKFLADPSIPSLETLQVDLPKATQVCRELRDKIDRRTKLMKGETTES